MTARRAERSTIARRALVGGGALAAILAASCSGVRTGAGADAGSGGAPALGGRAGSSTTGGQGGGPAAGGGGGPGQGPGGGAGRVDGGGAEVPDGGVSVTDVRVVDATLPSGTWFNATGNLAGMSSECGNLSYLSARPGSGTLIAGVAQRGLWASDDAGMTWTRLGGGAGSATITNRTGLIVYDPKTPQRFWEAGIYNSNGVYRTDDGGATFVALGDAHHDDGVSVDFSDAARRTLLAGGHEMAQTLYRSADGGATWTNVGANLPASAGKCNAPLVLDAQTHLVGCWDWDGSGGISRTTDGGQTWSRVYPSGVSSAQPLAATDGAIYFALSGGRGLVKSTDGGATWTELGSAGGALGSTSPVQLPDGAIATAGSSGVMVSRDGGSTWSAATPALPYAPWGLAYSTGHHAFFVWHFSCGTGDIPVPADAIMGFVVAGP